MVVEAIGVWGGESGFKQRIESPPPQWPHWAREVGCGREADFVHAGVEEGVKEGLGRCSFREGMPHAVAKIPQVRLRIRDKLVKSKVSPVQNWYWSSTNATGSGGDTQVKPASEVHPWLLTLTTISQTSALSKKMPPGLGMSARPGLPVPKSHSMLAPPSMFPSTAKVKSSSPSWHSKPSTTMTGSRGCHTLDRGLEVRARPSRIHHQADPIISWLRPRVRGFKFVADVVQMPSTPKSHA